MKRTTAAVAILAAFAFGVVFWPLAEAWAESTRANRYRREA